MTKIRGSYHVGELLLEHANFKLQKEYLKFNFKTYIQQYIRTCRPVVFFVAGFLNANLENYSCSYSTCLGPVVRKVDSTIQRIVIFQTF